MGRSFFARKREESLSHLKLNVKTTKASCAIAVQEAF